MLLDRIIFPWSGKVTAARLQARAQPRRRARGAVALAAGLALAFAGCGGVRLPPFGWPGAGNEGTARLFENRAWIDQGADAAPGSLRAFLSDGTLVMTSCVETYRLASWRWVRGPVLVWDEDGRTVLAEVALVGPDELALVIELAGGSVTRTFRAARAPVVCPDLPR